MTLSFFFSSRRRHTRCLSDWSSDMCSSDIPLVEVVGGVKTAPGAVQRAMQFYASIDKKPVHLRKELPGHVANRLQAALYREVMYLIQQDVLSVEDADDAVSYGPGRRWGGV